MTDLPRIHGYIEIPNRAADTAATLRTLLYAQLRSLGMDPVAALRNQMGCQLCIAWSAAT